MKVKCFCRKTLHLAVFLVAILIVSGSLSAQTITGAISGSVTDPTGAAVSGATVTVTNQETGVSQTMTTSDNGYYSAEALPVSKYSIEISKPGFQTSMTRGIQLNPGQRRANNIALKLGNSSARVTVTADAVQVNTETSANSGTISSKQISNLMLNGRNFQTLAIAIPGVSSTAGADSLTATNLNTINVNGLDSEYTMTTLDGMYDEQTASLGYSYVQPIVDGIAEFTVLKDNYSAKYGFGGSAQMAVVTKSGGSTFHGSVWEYLRNNAFDANNYFSTTTQALHQNIFGYTLGGPVIIPKLYNGNAGTKKTFFFAGNQWFIIRNGNVQRAAVFPQAMRNGDFSASPTLPASGALSLDPASVALLASVGKTNCLSGPTTINPACFDPAAVALFNAYVPLPNNVAGGFLNYINQESTEQTLFDNQYRIDHYFSQGNQLTARILYSQSNTMDPFNLWEGTPYSTNASVNYTPSFNGIISLKSSITPNLLNTVSVGEVYSKVTLAATKGADLPTGVSITQAFPNAPIMNRIPNISIAGGWGGLGVGPLPIHADSGEGQMADDLSWVKGNHVIQVGALYLFGIKRQSTFTVPQGSFSFSGAHSGDPAADYLLGLDSSYQQASSQRSGNFHYRQGEAYVQDDWKVKPRLILNLGLRWVYFSSDTASGDEVSSFNPNLYDPTQAPVVNVNGSLQINDQNQPITETGQPANLLNGLEFAGKNGVPSGFFTPVKTNFGPRVGFAYDVFGDGKTSVRGGYGMGYTREAIEQIYNAFGQNPPYNQSANILNSLLSDGTAGASAAPTTQTLNNVPFSFVPVRIQSYSLTVEHQINSAAVATLGYAGSVASHVTALIDNNFPLSVSTPSANGCLAPGQSPSTSYDFDPCINTSTSSPDYTRPYQGYSQIQNIYDDGMSNYNSLQAGLIYKTGSSQFNLAYTYSKAMTNVNTGSAGHNVQSMGVMPQNSRDFHSEYGPSPIDFTNNFTATWVYSIPYFDHGNRIATLALGKWSFAGLFLHQSGFAVSPYMSTATSGLATRPNQVGPVRKVGKFNEWFDTSAYAAPEFGFFGNASNGAIRQPGYTSANVALYKTFPIVARLNAEFRAEAFNVANHPNFNSVSTGLGSGNFGQLQGAADARILEFAFKLHF